MISNIIEVIIYVITISVVVATLLAMYFSRFPVSAEEKKVLVKADSLRVGDRIITPRGEAVVRRKQITKVKIPARTEESVVMGVNYSNSAGGDTKWTVGHDNVQVWTHDRLHKIVAPGLITRLRATLSQA